MWLGQGRGKKKCSCLLSISNARQTPSFTNIILHLRSPPKELDVWKAGFKIAHIGKQPPQYINGLTVQINKLMLIRVG